MTFTDQERRVLVYAAQDAPSDYGIYARAIRAVEIIEPTAVAAVLRSLEARGMLALAPLVNPNSGKLAGSGYVVTDAGRAEADRIKDEVTL
jgi:DNA-binding MarR family transcriptional regulator